ncbi:hypothetical protein AB0K15_47140 [Amycolatopsis sp. NPDC049253]|uniref:hypothetical protein n=1 Tax=Amycolatopsis sp. NPDC049253 TaxID=3155274 RepID=UPI003432D75C
MSTNRFRSQLEAAGRFVDEIAGEGVYPDGLTEAAIDALIEQVDLDLAADEFAAEAAFRCDFTDQRRASRTRRRAGRELLRSHILIAGLPGQGKNAPIQAAAFEGEAA